MPRESSRRANRHRRYYERGPDHDEWSSCEGDNRSYDGDHQVGEGYYEYHQSRREYRSRSRERRRPSRGRRHRSQDRSQRSCEKRSHNGQRQRRSSPQVVDLERREGQQHGSDDRQGGEPVVAEVRAAASSGESDIAKLTQALIAAVKIGSRGTNRFVNEKVLAEFDPEKKELSVGDWLDKVNRYGEIFEWSDAHKLYFATLRLHGLAKKWLEGLKEPPMSWQLFSEALSNQFSGEENFGKLFDAAGSYKSTAGQGLQAYCFEKVKRINRLKLNIPEEKVVEFIVYGIQNEQLRANLTTAKKRTIAELNQCLEELSTENGKETKNARENNGARPYGSFDRSSHKYKRVGADSCFKCGKPGHRQANCPQLEKDGKKREPGTAGGDTSSESKTEKVKLKCTYCSKLGHLEKDCYGKRNDEKRKKSSA